MRATSPMTHRHIRTGSSEDAFINCALPPRGAVNTLQHQTPPLVDASSTDSPTNSRSHTRGSGTAIQLGHAPLPSGQAWVNHVVPCRSACVDYLLVAREKRHFHESWVADLAVLPMLRMCAHTTTRVECGSHVGPASLMCLVGTCLIATSYDSTTSFWPMRFPETCAQGAVHVRVAEACCGRSNTDNSVRRAHLTPSHSSSSSSAAAAAVCVDSMRCASAQRKETAGVNLVRPTPRAGASDACESYLLVNGPTLQQKLHTDFTLRTLVGGGGTSFFVVSICCRGRVKIWSTVVTG